jgi:hypothetical protein
MIGLQRSPIKLQHSVKVPKFYKTAANIAKRAAEERRSLRDLVFSANKHLVSSAGLVWEVTSETELVVPGP